MNEKPILFSGEMVCAILGGHKTQTRRHAKFSDFYRLTDERITAIHSNDEYEIAIKTDSGISERRLPSGERWEDLLPDALRWIWTQGARGLVCVGRPRGRKGILPCFIVPQQQEGDKIGSSSGLYGVSWYAANADTPNQTLEREPAGQQAGESDMGNAGGKLERPPRAWHCNGWGEALGVKIVRRGSGSYSLRRNNGSMFPAPRRTSLGDVTICHFRNVPWIPKTKIWVKETHLPKNSGTIYRADFNSVEAAGIGAMYGGWKPSIFCKRIYSRITLEIVSIGVERLQDISEEDAIAEGMVRSKEHPQLWTVGVQSSSNPIYLYELLWELINGDGSWAKNPWVWVIEFKPVACSHNAKLGGSRG